MLTIAVGHTPLAGTGLRQDDGRNAPAAQSVRLPNGERFRTFDVAREDPERLISLKEAVYGVPVDRQMFEWEYFGHPRSREIRVFVAENDGVVIASTTRLPATIRVDGVDRAAYFNIDSMVHPAHRRRGRMRDLYQFARARLPGSPALFSKGSSTQIYPLLISIGHREILPNTHLVNYPSATRWLLSRLHLRSPVGAAKGRPPVGFEDFCRIARFGPELDGYFDRVSRKFHAIFRRDAAFMNWRYVDIPHRRYAAFVRREGTQICSVVVLSCDGPNADIVDLFWDPDLADEPDRTIRFAQAFCDERHVVRLACFATHPRLREALTGCGFLDRGESPRFSALVPPGLEAAFGDGAEVHAVDGDGDTEFS